MKGLQKIVCTVAFFIACLSSFSGFGQQPVAQKGIIDLQKANLFDKHLKLNGEWAFYWNHLLTPDSLATATPDYIPFPVLWKEVRFHGQSLPAQGYATYALTILLPKKRPRLGMEIHHVYSSYKLFVNGVFQAQNVQPATTLAKATPFS